MGNGEERNFGEVGIVGSGIQISGAPDFINHQSGLVAFYVTMPDARGFMVRPQIGRNFFEGRMAE